MNSTSLRRTLVVAHRWAGLGSSVLLAVIGLTGVAFLFPAPASVRLFVEEFHVTLMIPRAGQAIVIAATTAAVLLEMSGLYLWWRRKVWTVRWRSGWRTAAEDLHHLTGAALLAVMLLLAGTGLGRVAIRQVLPASHLVVKATNYAHTGLKFPAPIRVVYAIGGVGFLVQGLTGVIMWSRRGGRAKPVAAGARPSPIP
jgi:uncharacterized iron-regulated membrane protein